MKRSFVSTGLGLKNREYRPTWIFYLPLYCWYFFQSLRFRSVSWVIASNPGLENGGIVVDSKRSLLRQFDKKHIPQTRYWDGKESSKEMFFQTIQGANLSYPCIVKADRSRRSQKVVLVYTVEDIIERSHDWGAIVVQEYRKENEEFGVTYVRYPDQQKGKIIGLMHRKFASIVGDGVSSLSQIICNHERYHHYLDILYVQNKDRWEEIIPSGERIVLMPFGAHSRGTVFEDWTDRISPELEQIVDQIAQQVDGFYIGRFDIKADSLSDLTKGNFKILELNGVGGIPAHMYDPKYSIVQGWRILFSYRNAVAKISHSILITNNIKLPSFREMYNIVSQPL